MKLLRRPVAAMKRRYLHQVSDVYFVSFPKSGRTWTKSVLANYFAIRTNSPIFHDFAPIRRRPGVPRVVFTHANYSASDVVAASFIRSLRNKRVVLLVRDPGDTTQSHYYRLLKRQRSATVKGLDLESFALSDEVGVAQVVRFLRRWGDAADRFEDFLLLRYESCVENPVEHFSALLRFIGEDVDHADLERAIARSLDTTRKIEAGGAEVDETVEADRRIGPAIYFGRENADELERFETDGLRLLDSVTPKAARQIEAIIGSLPAELAEPNPKLERRTQ